ncbi:ubiquitin carboxyl-terminal hydrolase 19 isoform X3 [Scleropages formosus]|uniref:ubiquitinyl hydrolase 1 n=1 Tax=Scleropages formosus TaxID=113540 RepID=A0A8C9S1Y1_SCLFO|nr:ubiquitin carboxyl-terminal hydrolase 19 isoform X3 [Scleropages formosus]
MASSAEVSGRRRAPRGTEDSASKKKQKDKANQESKEAKRTAGEEAKKDVQFDWRQNANEVIVKLRSGDGILKAEDVNAGFSDTACQVRFPDGRQWSCHLHAEIEGSCSKVQYKEKGSYLQLVMPKKIPFNPWPSLMQNKKEKEPVNIQIDNSIKEQPRKLEQVEEKLDLAQVPSQPQLVTEHARSKPDRGIKRTIKNKLSDQKPESVTKGPEITAPAAKVDHPVEPCAKRTSRTLRNSKDTGLGPVKEGSTRSPANSRPEGRQCLSAPQSRDRRVRQLSGSQGNSSTQLEAVAERKQEKPQAVPLDVVAGWCPSVQDHSEAEVLPRAENRPCEGSTEGKATSYAELQGEEPLDSRGVKTFPVELEATLLSDDLGAGEPLPVSLPAIVCKEDKDSCRTSMEEKTDVSKDESLEKVPDGAPEPMVNLTFVKSDSYEKGNDLMVVNVYLKGICRETAKVLFREQDFTLIFQTSDATFLRLHPDCGPNTVFKWQVKLRNLIDPDQSVYAFTPSRLDITLKKRHSQRWGGLEAPATQGAVGGAKVAVPSGPASLDKSQPGSSQHPLPAKEEPRAGDKEKPVRSEDGGLDTVAARTVVDHVPIKQEPHVTTPKPMCMVPPMTHAPPASNERAEEEEEKKVCLPGFTGLVNLGNTCFMNSVIQSLSNTRELRDYFHDRAFEAEINCSNPLGTGGRLAIGFAVLLRALWKGTHHAFQPSKLKAIVASKASQFTGYAQHDAQEFMAFLLDGLHEDLNRIQNKPYTETVDSDGRQDEVVAEEAWQRHKMRNDSFIVDLFQGQYKSKLVCPICSKVSITFDPFLYLPVPLPQKQKVLTVFYFAKEPHQTPIKFLVSVSKENSTTAEVLESISRSVRVKPENLRLTEVSKSRFQRIFHSSYPLDNVSPSDMLLCFEVLSKDLSKEKVVVLQVQQRPQVPSLPIGKCSACHKPPQGEDEKLRRCTRCYRVGYCNQICQKNHWPIHKSVCGQNIEFVGLPFLISVPESRLTYTRLTQLLQGYSRYSVDVFQPPCQSGRLSPETSQSRVGLSSTMSESLDSSGQEYDTGHKQEQQSSSPSLSALTEARQGAGDAISDLDTLSTRTADSGFSEPQLDSHNSLTEKETTCEKAVKPEAAVTGYQHPGPESASGPASQFYISLLDVSRKEQKLEDKGDGVLDIPDDSILELVWKNNERMKEYVLVKTKELEFVEDASSASETARAGHFTLEQCLNLFTKPEVLAPEEAWYCPKCQQHREASKQLMLWRLPNVLIIQLKRFSFRSFIWRDKINDMVDFPVRNLDLSKFCIGQKDDMQHPPIYDLYAVINHYGGMIGGHYTAYARLPNDKNSQRSDVGWRLFDDSTVTTVEESQVVTRYAYVLFYRRRNSPVERPVRLPSPRGAESPTAAGATASQASDQAMFGPDLDPEGPPQLTPEVTAELFTHSGDCATPSYSNMEEVD